MAHLTYHLHHRDTKAVAGGGGMYHVIPAGVFQPAALAPAHQNNDSSLWRNVQREFCEEFLGNREHDGNSIDPISYDTDEPFASFERARQAGDFRVFACAMVLEPLTLTVELVTVAVIEAPVFDALFAGMVHGPGETIQATLNSLYDRLRALDGLAGKGVHASVTNNEVDICIVQTYLVLGDVLRYRKGEFITASEVEAEIAREDSATKAGDSRG